MNVEVGSGSRQPSR